MNSILTEKFYLQQATMQAVFEVFNDRERMF